ncbi:hypothetical protein [Pseudomonas sp. DR 5-09]|jgi:hypothetical protein|uniref:hypothetical protein n=1 Tax=Pseudomonas sp. DR 5-09 TaxID=1534110 RepID=UPI0009EE9A7C|nr:hypothetical protein [Pseudomonas sp. DR 5-09]
MKFFKKLVISLIIICSLVIVAIFALLERDNGKGPVLKDHPNAFWSGAEDGGSFFEITKSSPPNYYVEIRHESGDIWSKGWVTHVKKGGGRLLNEDFMGYDGGDDVYLQDETALKLNPELVK